MKKKIHVGIIFGGRSAEHEVSIHSAKNVLQALDKNKYEISLIGIDQIGGWHFGHETQYILEKKYPALKSFNKIDINTLQHNTSNKNLVISSLPEQAAIHRIDVFFPILHGPYGEDGTIQGLLKLAGKAFVGSGVLGSAIGMDKDVMKRLLLQAKIPVAKFLVFNKPQLNDIFYETVAKDLGKIFFIKPANLGSSVGVHKVKNANEFQAAVQDAFLYDTKILAEEYIDAREIECSVLGNDNPLVSLPGEIIPSHEFYSYESKYLDENGARIEVPAKLSEKQTEQIQELAIRAFQVLCCEGFARVDFFLRKDSGQVFVNEINTIPGFTKVSMYPKLWEASGITYPELIDRLIKLAIERFKKEQRLKTSLI